METETRHNIVQKLYSLPAFQIVDKELPVQNANYITPEVGFENGSMGKVGYQFENSTEFQEIQKREFENKVLVEQKRLNNHSRCLYWLMVNDLVIGNCNTVWLCLMMFLTFRLWFSYSLIMVENSK